MIDVVPTNEQVAPYPDDLADLVDRCRYRAGWTVRLHDFDRGQGSEGLTLVITTDTVNSYPPHDRMRVNHLFPVPPAAYNRQSWQRWLFDQFMLVEDHECMEFFEVDGEKPYAPNHGPGHDPYTVRELTTDLDRRTSFRGELDDVALLEQLEERRRDPEFRTRLDRRLREDAALLEQLDAPEYDRTPRFGG